MKEQCNTIDEEQNDDLESSSGIDISTLPPKQQAYAILQENGIKAKDISKMVGYTQGSGYIVSAKLNKLRLNNPKIVKDAHKVIKNILQGKTWGAVEHIKDSSALMAANMVYDRFEPKVNQNVNLNVNIPAPVELDRWKR